MGQIGISRSDFLMLTEEEYNEIYLKWIEAQDTAGQQEWERARWQTFRTVYPPRPKAAMISIQDFGQFPWEKTETEEHAPVKSTKERFEYLKDKWA